jgi:hypothetical protein
VEGTVITVTEGQAGTFAKVSCFVPGAGESRDHQALLPALRTNHRSRGDFLLRLLTSHAYSMCASGEDASRRALAGQFADPQLSVPILFKLDQGKPEHTAWAYDSSGWYRAPNSVALAKRLAAGQKLILEYQPAFGDTTLDQFNLSGLSTLLPKVANACGWKS